MLMAAMALAWWVTRADQVTPHIEARECDVRHQLASSH